MSRFRFALLPAVALPTLVVGILAPTTPAAAADVCTALNGNVLQVINPTSGTSLLTPWYGEATGAAAYGFTSWSGADFVAGLEPAAGLSPVSRLYNAATRDFAWSPSATDTSELKAKGYAVDKVEFYASATPLSCTIPVNRFVKGTLHRHATGIDAATLRKDGWTDEGVSFHAKKGPGYVADWTTPSTQPTTSPSVSPTTSPTAVPTSSPTSSPSVSPTASPSVSPTVAPTSSPTASPSVSPSVSPSATPTPATTLQAPTGQTAADLDGKFSLAIYPDTQMEVMNSTDKRLSNRNAYVLSQRASRDIRYALHVGDLVNWDTASDANPTDHRQYDWASREMKNLEAGGLPWATAIGNHDTYAVGPTGGSARPGVVTAQAVRNTQTFNSYFPVARFGNISGTYEAGKVDNAYRLFTAAGKKWMILNLELWPRQGAIDWAKSVVAKYPTHNVIVLTHSYLEGSGTISTNNGGYGATAPTHLYSTFISQYPNIKFVFSGHVNTSAVRTDPGVGGNKVVSMLTSFHDYSTNQVRFLEIDTKNGSIATDIEAPYTGLKLPAYTQSVTGLTFVG